MKMFWKKSDNNTSGKIHSLIPVCLIVITFGVLLAVLCNIGNIVNAAEQIVSADGKYTIPPQNDELAKGSEDNPFVVLEIAPAEYKARMAYLVAGEEPIDVQRALDTEPDETMKILGDYIQIDEKGKYYNPDLFKKLCIGLGYIDNDLTKGEDTSRYMFLGWYLEKECVNPVTGKTRITGNTRLYAKWRTMYPTDEANELNGNKNKPYMNTYTVSFNGNCSDSEAASLIDMPGNIRFIEPGDTLVSPAVEPKLRGKIFSGWYTDKQCTDYYSFDTPVTSDVTLYAGWKELGKNQYTINFNANIPAGADASGVTGMPDNITGYCENGCSYDYNYNNGEYKAAVSESEPVLSGYIFAGWYYDSGCTRLFESGNAISKDAAVLENGVITLYAGWKAEGDTYTVTFDVNKPDTAIFDVELDYGMLDGNKLSVGANGLINSEVKDIIPTLDGNVAKKVRDYHVKVITTTPEDYYDDGACYNPSNPDNAIAVNKYKDNNLKLVDRADLIVVNQGKTDIYFQRNNEEYEYSFMLDYMHDGAWRTDRKYHYNHYHGNKGDTTYGSEKAIPYLFGTYNQYFSIDLSWELTMRIFKKASVGSKGDGSDKCPVLFDYYSIDESNLQDVQSNPDIPYTTSDGETIYLKDTDIRGVTNSQQGKASRENIYKLYLMTQQTNPETIYDLYINGGAQYAEICADGEHAGSFMTYDEEGNPFYYDVWNYKTLFPFEFITKDEFDRYYKNLHGYIGRDDPSGITQSMGFDDYPRINENVVNNNMLMVTKTQDGFPNLIRDLVNRVEVTPDIGMRNYITDEVREREGYNTTNALYYLINVKQSLSSFSKNINILEIEPLGGNENFKSDKQWELYIKRYYDNFTGKINVTRMSSSEFVGDVDVLTGKYDMIYIGTNDSCKDTRVKGLLANKTSWGSDKCTYSHTGVYISGNGSPYLKLKGGSLGEQNDWDIVTDYIASGNDITKVKYREILEFAEAGYPVVFGGSFIYKSFSKENDITSECISSNRFNISEDKRPDLSVTIDSASYIYKLADTMLSEKNADGTYRYRNSLYFDNCTDSKSIFRFTKSLGTRLFELKLSDKPVEYVDRTLPKYSGYTDDQIYINGDNINEKTLEYRFRITEDNNKSYSVSLYIDSNADGKFFEDEKIDSLDIYDRTSGKNVRYNRLTGGHNYTLRRDIEDYVGAIPWKLEVVDNSNKIVSASRFGQCAVKATEKTEIKVLQIVSNEIDGYLKNNVYLPTDEEISRAKENMGDISTANMTTYFEGVIEPLNTLKDNIEGYGDYSDLARSEYDNVLKNSGIFAYYLSQLDLFDVHFDRMSVKEFEEKVEAENGKYDFMKEYNMLILGYADCFSDVNDAACRIIEKFINKGNTTLFTHDTTSFVNLDESRFNNINSLNQKYWGYNINRYFRNIVGMDRYDVTGNRGDKEIIDNSDSSHDKPYAPASLQSENKYVMANGTSKVLSQGMTNATIASEDIQYSTKVTKTNDGQIVSYPYNIPNSIDVAKTHSQYYQLDLEEDDIVVWYCIGQSGNDDWCHGIKNDVRNNYYIYNKGNITYSGAGHSSDMTVDEIKLFINTMIASYNATVRPALPFVTNSDKSTDNVDTDYVYIDYDSTVSVDEAEPFGQGVYSGILKSNGEDVITKRIFFKVKNSSIATNKKIEISYYPVIADDAGNKTVLSDSPLKLNIYRVEDEDKKGDINNSGASLIGNTPVDVSASEEYYVDIPISDNYYSNILHDGKIFKALDQNNDFMLQIRASMTYGKNPGEIEPLVGTRYINIMRRGMFSLD